MLRRLLNWLRPKPQPESWETLMRAQYLRRRAKAMLSR